MIAPYCRALTSAPLPDGVLALIYRSPRAGEPGTILMSTKTLSPAVQHVAWIALNEDIARHPNVDASDDRTIELRENFSVRFPDGSILQIQALTNAAADAAEQARWEAKEEANRQVMIGSFEDAPEANLHGFQVRLRRDT